MAAFRMARSGRRLLPVRALILGAWLGLLGPACAQGVPAAPACKVPDTKGQRADAPGKGGASASPLALDLPPREQIFRPEGDAAFRQRIVAELQQVTRSTEVPKDARPGPTTGPVHGVDESVGAMYVPNVVCYNPLYFEQRRPERYVRYVPPLQPLISAARFYLDVVALPVKVVLWPPWARRCNDHDPSRGPEPLSPLPH